MDRSERRVENIILLVNIIVFIPSIIFHTIGLYISINLQYQIFIIYIGSILLLINWIFVLQLKNYNNFGNLINYDSQNNILRSCLFFSNILNLFIYFDLKLRYEFFYNFFLISMILNSIILFIPYIIIVTFFIMLVYCVPNLLIESSTNNNVTGLSIQQINQLTIDYASINLNERCNICLSKIKSGESIRKLECNHNFHSECLDKWLLEKNNCPNCRKIISSNIDNI